MSLHLLGIRHHGPGSSRHVLDALAAIRPDIILIEGPPEGEAMLQWVAHEGMKPPVAMLGYVPDDPKRAVFYPFTAYCPEWNAIKYGLEHKIPIRFIDMPLVHSLAPKSVADEKGTATAGDEDETEADSTDIEMRKNPLSHLAEIAGFDDAEEWWEHMFELAQHPSGAFDAVANAITALRQELPQRKDETEDIREAYMRKGIRTAQREMYSEIAVVCGAWHVPALSHMPKQKDDDALIKNLPKTKVETTWIPWTNDRLSFSSGYGAGVDSPGWYSHTWNNPGDDGVLWLSHTARIFRNAKVDISSAHIIEAVRLAGALAGLRQLARPGLRELSEATVAVMCMGDGILMRLIDRELIVGRELGEVPEGTPQVPLQRDLDMLIKKLRLKISNDEKPLKLDLREENDLQKSVLLHRLQLLDVDWGRIQRTSGKGTFKEEWTMCWYPELTIKLLEKAAWGNTIEAAANKYLEDTAATGTLLPQITELVAKALPADLQSAVRYTMKRMDELAAGTQDIAALMDAFIPLVQVSRYGNVRKTDLDTVRLILDGIFYRIAAGLPMGCTGIDEEQAEAMAANVRRVTQAVLLLEDNELRAAWMETARKIVDMQAAAPMVRGCCCKMLYDAGELDAEATANEFSKALSVNNSPAEAAGWLEGFLRDAATVLILDEGIWDIVNGWLAGLDGETFRQVVPLLRRTFSVYSNAEKRKIAARAGSGASVTARSFAQQDVDVQRAESVLPVLEMLMGL